MKKLIIVCEEKLKNQGDFLAQLISAIDDKNGEIIGVKDGEVVATVWTEKEYSDNSTHISSEQYIVFIGNSKLIKGKRTHMLKKWEKFGMNYGWLGKQATLFVEKVIDMDSYKDFIEYAKGNNTNIEDKLRLKSAIPLELNAGEDNKKIDKVFNSFKKITNKLANASIDNINKLNKISNNKDIEEQEYTCLVFEFYLNGLAKFLDMIEE